MRRLTLTKDTLAELATDELRLVGGGADYTKLVPTWYECPLTGLYPTLPVHDCLAK